MDVPEPLFFVRCPDSNAGGVRRGTGDPPEHAAAQPAEAAALESTDAAYRAIGIKRERAPSTPSFLPTGCEKAHYAPLAGDRVTWMPSGHKGTGHDAEVLRSGSIGTAIRIESKGVPPREAVVAATELMLVRRPAAPPFAT